MRTGLKTIEDTKNGSALAINFAGEQVLLDPAGIMFIKSIGVLIVSDLHLEKGSSYARRGQFLPPYDTAATLERLLVLIDKYNPKTIISLGDSFHDDDASQRLDDTALEAIHAMANGRDMVWVTGNHDPSAPSHLPGNSVTEIGLGNMTLRHIASKAETSFEISGHYHPCASIRVRGKRVRRACFACDGQRLIMPSFGVLTGGLHLSDKAYAGLFNKAALRAYMQGRDQIFTIEARNIEGL